MRHGAAVLVVVCALVAAGALLVLTAAPARVLTSSLVGDDAGYYVRIAREVVQGHGVTFDGDSPTDGFNPLYLGLLVASLAVAPEMGPLASLRVAGVISWLALAGGGALFTLVVGRMAGAAGIAGGRRRLLAAACCTYYTLFLGLKGVYGIDAPLVLLLGNAYLLVVLREGLVDKGWGAQLADGVLLGLLFLARVDSVFILLAAYGAGAMVVARRPRLLPRLAASAAAATAVAGPYLVWHRAAFGHWLPISAHIKTGFPRIDLAHTMDITLHGSLHVADVGLFGVAYALALSTLAWSLARSLRHGVGALVDQPHRAIVVVMALYVSLRTTFLLLFARMDVQTAHLIWALLFPPLWLLAAVAELPRHPTPRATERLAAIASAVFVGLALSLAAGKGAAVHGRLQSSAGGEALDSIALAARIREQTVETDVLYGGAFGLLGLFSERTWINADGVVNTFAYQDALAEEGGLPRYLDERGVTHLVGMAPRGLPKDDTVELQITGWVGGRVHTLTVDRDDILLQARLSDRSNQTVWLASWTRSQAGLGAGSGSRPLAPPAQPELTVDPPKPAPADGDPHPGGHATGEVEDAVLRQQPPGEPQQLRPGGPVPTSE